MSSAKASQPFWPATVLLLLACLYQPSVSQRYGQPIHKFFTNPLVRYPGGAEVNFVDSTIRRIALPHPVIFGATRTAYHEMFLHKQIPGFVFFRNPNVPPDIEALYPKPYVKVLNEFRDRSQNKVDFFVRSIRISATANCVDRKFANLFKDTANQVFTYSDTGYFSPQSITAVTFRRPAGQAVGSLAEIVFVNSGVDTVAFVTYGGVPASDLHAAGFYDVGAGSSGSLALPPRFTEESNMAESGSWAFRLSHPTGVASANVDQSLRRILDMTAQTQGFLSDRLLGCPCSLCDSRAKCLNIASETMRVIDGFAKCCRCQGLNSYLGNGYECADTGTPLPVFFPSLPSDSSANSNVEGNATFVQGNLDIFFRPMDSSSPSPTQRQLTALIKLSEPVLANIALLTAASKSDSIQNLFALSNVIRRRMQLTAMDERKTTTYASWTIEQTIWNQVLFKATNTTIKIDSISDALSSGLAVALLNQDQRATQYEFTRVQRNWLTLESRPPTNFTVTPIPIDFTKSLPTLRIDFTDTWDLSPSCQVETRVGKLLLERDYNQLDMPEGFHFTRLVGNVTRLRTCRDLTCGPGSQCVVEGPVGQAQCRCLPGYVESGAGACRAVCGPNLCDVNAECLINKCICASGYSGDGLVCQADDRDCRLAQAACRPEDGFACMQQATRSGIEYRCQCGSSKCIREADAACRQQAGCSQFANCLPGANGGPSTCVCRQGFKGDGRVCLPELCADNATCSDAGAYAFCNASRLCDTCPPPKSIAAGRCLSRPCQPSDCMENAQCDPVSNACVCKPGFAANRLGGCSIACRTVQDCNKDVLPNDLEILNATMGCMSGVCECRPGYTVDRQDATSLTLTCTNCDSDSMCLRGATCQTDVRLSGVRLCKCPPGKVGNGKSACDECQPGQTGSSPLACGTNAKCESRPGGRTCRCRYGYKSENPKDQGCVKEDTLLMLSNGTQITLYEGQTEMEMFCRVIRGPVRTKDLIWTAIKGVPMPIDEGTDRLVQFVLNDRKVLRFSRVVKSDAKEYHCFPSVAGEDSASLSVNITVLDNPCRQCHAQAFCNYSRPGCQCSRGYSGDGVNRCDRASCIEQQLCDPDTELCLFNRDTGQYTCECAPGMERVQGRCQRRQEACTETTGCHANAECALVDGRRQCRCREGFSGDGKLRCERDGPGCNFYNRCVKNSECKYSELDNKYRCVCASGYFGQGDTSCRASVSCDTCRLNAGTCEQETVEHRRLDGRVEQVQLRVCRCPPGRMEVLTSSGATVCRTRAQIGRTLYVAQGDAIFQMPADDSQSDSSTVRRLFIAMSSASAAASGPGAPRPGSPVVAMDYNCNRKQLVWSVYGHPRLYAASTADSGAGGPVSSTWVPFGEGLEKVEGLAVDWQTDNVYYTAQYVSKDEATRGARFGEIGVIAYRQGVAYKKVLFRGPKDGVVRPRGIAVDPFLGKIYYADWDRMDPRVMMASMNGANHVKLVSTGSPLPNDVIRRFDSRNEEVCYSMADLPPNSSLQNLSAARRNSSSTQVAVQCLWRPVPDAAYVERSRPIRIAWSGEPFGMAYAEGGDFYWTNWLTNKIVGHNVNLNRTFVRGPFGSLENLLLGVAVDSAACPASGQQVSSGEHPCADSRGYGDCKYICLAAPNQGVECVCPDNDPKCNPYINRPTEASRAAVKKAMI
ncbi:hypothetical protein BOX15_Mlig009317g2 [Macrostomum lignano]|uniref:EGF-like domain-containing protein n=1 Tax=Macrostomum lignano TaxID=282301 RepID=A0A267DGY8_9PLAT|nr:hypothetical protein BOX15_Mlig009317g2 [Macrostomum lignano]